MEEGWGALMRNPYPLGAKVSSEQEATLDAGAGLGMKAGLHGLQSLSLSD
jgi:hypothetical protein